jgi:hypothetical protein
VTGVSSSADDMRVGYQSQDGQALGLSITPLRSLGYVERQDIAVENRYARRTG